MRPPRGRIAIKALEMLQARESAPILDRNIELIEERLAQEPDIDVPWKEWRRKWQR